MSITNALVYLKPEVDTALASKITTVDSIADLLAIPNPFDGMVVWVKQFYKGVNRTISAHSRTFIASEYRNADGFTNVKGWCVVGSDITLPQCGGYSDGLVDDTAALQALVNYKQNIASTLTDKYNGMSTPQTINLVGVTLLKGTIYLRGDLIRFSGGGSCVVVDKTGTFDNNYVFNITGGSGFGSYSGYTGALFEGILFKSTDQIVDLFYTALDKAAGGNGGTELRNIKDCSFLGFRRIWSHGISGWGWNWSNCQFCLNTTLLYCTQKQDTGERATFSGCIWQNGGYLLTFAGGGTPVYWSGGSLDYCGGILNQTEVTGANFPIFIQSHFEWNAAPNTPPCVVLLEGGITLNLSGNMVLSADDAYTVFRQFRNYQINLDRLFISGGKGWSDKITIDDKYLVNARGAILPNDGDGEYHSASKLGFVDVIDIPNKNTLCVFNLTNSNQHTAKITDRGLVLASTGGAGADGSCVIDIPIPSDISLVCIQSSVIPNTTQTIYVTTELLDLTKTIKKPITDYGITKYPQQTTSTFVSHGLLKNIPIGSGFVRVTINLFGVSLDQPLIIQTLRLFYQ